MQNYMDFALKQAKIALKNGEVPVGAVIVKSGKIISRAYNKRETRQNALYHAEILAIDKACKRLKSFRLDDCEMFVTLEPCLMCSGAILNARLKTVVFGASDENLSVHCAEVLEDKPWEHKVTVVGGVCAKECQQILQEFFSSIREKNKFKRLIGKSIAGKTFGLCLDFKEFLSVQDGSVVAVVEKTKTMEMTPVFSKTETVFSADEIYEILKRANGESVRIKIVTKWGEKKYFN